MNKDDIIKSIATRTGGDIYLGVVGEVRTGKSTFINKVVETLVIPNNVAKIKVDELECNIRLVDCVGYVIENSKGYEDENGPRLVMTPWVLLNK